jgi:hypothetical protein
MAAVLPDHLALFIAALVCCINSSLALNLSFLSTLTPTMVVILPEFSESDLNLSGKDWP